MFNYLYRTFRLLAAAGFLILLWGFYSGNMSKGMEPIIWLIGKFLWFFPLGWRSLFYFSRYSRRYQTFLERNGRWPRYNTIGMNGNPPTSGRMSIWVFFLFWIGFSCLVVPTFPRFIWRLVFSMPKSMLVESGGFLFLPGSCQMKGETVDLLTYIFSWMPCTTFFLFWYDYSPPFVFTGRS